MSLMYHLVYNFLYLISLLPLGVLYLFSDLAYFIIYHLFGYRKKVVLQNLTIAFPHINTTEKLFSFADFSGPLKKGVGLLKKIIQYALDTSSGV